MIGEFTDECISFPRRRVRRVRREWQCWLPLVDHSIHGDGLLSLGCSWFFERRNRQEDAYPDRCDRGGAHRCPRGAAPAVRGWNRAHATERFEPSPSRRCDTFLRSAPQRYGGIGGGITGTDRVLDIAVNGKDQSLAT